MIYVELWASFFTILTVFLMTRGKIIWGDGRGGSSLQPITRMVQPKIRTAPKVSLKIERDFILEWVIS